MSCDAGDEYADVYHEELRRARKEHRCCACGETVRRGDRYRVTNIVYEGTVDTYKHCLRCFRILKLLASEHRKRDTEQVPEIELGCGHSWQEVFEEEPPPEVARLAFLTADEAQREFAK